MAPEIHLGRGYSGEAVDLFAAATILFTMVSQKPPFDAATVSDPLYRLIGAGRFDLFWDSHIAAFSEDIYSESFKDLFEHMVVLNYKKRFTMAQVLAHPWLKGPTPTKRAVQEELKQRRTLVEGYALAQIDLKRERRQNR